MLALKEGHLEGQGVEFLAKEAADAQFILVGEDHGLAQMPQFVAALFDTVRPAGFGHLVVEAGPLAAGYLTRTAIMPDARSAFVEFGKKYPYAMAFFFWREETEMLERVVKSLGDATEPIWGIDQEFIGAGTLHLERLLQLAPDDTARKAAQKSLDYARQDIPRMIEQKNPGGMFVLSAKTQDYQELRTAFAASPEALGIIRELERSTAIYRMNTTGSGWLSNFERARLTKEYFRAFYERAAQRGERLPRAVFKYGANHAKRGRGYLGVHDLGNMASELAEFNGLQSLHILVICTRGTVNAYRMSGDDEAAKEAPYEAVKAYASIMDIKPLIDASDPTAWTLIDVRPVRRHLSRRFKDIDRNLSETLWGYDAVLIIPECTASTLLN